MTSPSGAPAWSRLQPHFLPEMWQQLYFPHPPAHPRSNLQAAGRVTF